MRRAIRKTDQHIPMRCMITRPSSDRNSVVGGGEDSPRTRNRAVFSWHKLPACAAGVALRTEGGQAGSVPREIGLKRR